jgi:hypothetical protein
MNKLEATARMLLIFQAAARQRIRSVKCSNSFERRSNLTLKGCALKD